MDPRASGVRQAAGHPGEEPRGGELDEGVLPRDGGVAVPATAPEEYPGHDRHVVAGGHRAAHVGQADGGDTIDSWRGTR